MSEEKNVFIHHVYFWLNEPATEEYKAELIAGLKKLSHAKTIQRFHIGEPANTSRDVIDGSYAISWCLFFANAADQETYQTDPVHLFFIAENKHLWKKVIVYDSVNV